jgi:lipoic acid synthetase
MDTEKKRPEEEAPLPLALSPSTFAEATADKKGRGKREALETKQRLPPWIRVRISGNRTFDAVHDLLNECNLNTVCSGAHCPNKHECFSRGTATFMILGDTCTRDCRFCAVNTGVPAPVDEDEPRRVAEAAARLKLKHVVVTSVTRDDLPDGGASLFAATILAVRERLPGARVEVLVPDFQGRESDIDVVLAARPDVFNHNVETVRRLQRVIRPAADYERSLGVLRYVAEGGGQRAEDRGQRAEDGRPVVKSGLMVGLGETDEEIHEAIMDLQRAGCELLTIGQYLAPSAKNHPVERFVTPEQFQEYAKWGVAAGFLGVASAPMVRSSYHAEEQWAG